MNYKTTGRENNKTKRKNEELELKKKNCWEERSGQRRNKENIEEKGYRSRRIELERMKLRMKRHEVKVLKKSGLENKDPRQSRNQPCTPQHNHNPLSLTSPNNKQHNKIKIRLLPPTQPPKKPLQNNNDIANAPAINNEKYNQNTTSPPSLPDKSVKLFHF